ncbi:MAG: T9SS type A sorting domain-containing protein [Bacteroidia bacterium]|jgi:hypothetical protein
MKSIIYKTIVVIACILTDCTAAMAQLTWSDCGGANNATSGTKSIPCTPVSSTYTNRYGRVSGYVPVPSVTPTKIVRISFHFFQKNNGSNNWQNDASHLSRLNTIVNSWMNPRMASLSSPSDPITGVTHIPNSTIQYEVSGIYFYQNDYLNTLVTCNANAYESYVNGIDPSRISGSVPIYVTGGAYCGPPALGFSAFPSETNLSQNSYVVTFNAADNPTQDYAWSGHLLHELGHSLDLYHTYDYNQYMLDLDYLSDVYNTSWWNYCTPPANYACVHQGGWGFDPYNSSYYSTNNLMGGTQSNEYLSPLQLGKANRALAIKSVRKYVKSMISSSNDWVVNQNETWDFDIQMYQNIKVTNGATLTIKCKVAMATNGSITLDPGANLIITDGALITSWTGSMWTGIILNSGTSLLVDNASTIEKAKVAIESRLGAPFTIQNGSKLNANYVAIRIGPYSGTHPGVVKNSTISCYNSSGLPANALIAPYAGLRTSKGVDIMETVTQVNIGVDQSGQTNTFDNMDMGIYCLRSGLRVYNTNFKNISGSGFSGRCIGSYSNTTTERLLVVGGNNNSYQKNTFVNSTTGIYASGSMDVSVLSNTMNNLTTGVSINNCSYSGNGFNISNNTIDDCSTGIYSIDCAGSSGFWVLSNNINIASPTSNSKPNSKAISILNTSLNTNPQLSIFYNNIKRVSTGIEVTNHTAPSIQSNNITSLSNLGSSIQSNGILVANCPSLNLRTNLVKGIGASAWWMNGIRIEPGCVLSVVLYNSVEDIGRGLFFSGGNLGTETAKNHMKNNMDGFVLNSSTIGYQNGSSSSCRATENTWEGTFSGSHIFSYYSDGTQSIMNLYGSPCNTLSGPCMYPNNLVSTVDPPTGYSAVPTPVCGTLSGRNEDNSKLLQFQQLANDEHSYPALYSVPSKWWANYSLYNLLRTDTAMLADTALLLGTSDLQTFADSILTNNIGKLYGLNELINHGDIAAANISINVFNPENTIEQNLKDVYTITIANWVNDSLNSNEINTLQAIAKLCPYESGPAVYNARALLSTLDTAVYINECEIVPSHIGTHKNMLEEDSTAGNIVVFPNPANDKITIFISLNEQQTATLSLYDIAGKLILSDTFNAGNDVKQTSISTLSEGMYIYKVNVNNNNVTKGKLVISR